MSIPASRFTDSICCAKDLMPGSVVAPCAAEVFIGGVPAARLTDLSTCNHGHVAPIAEGAEMVLIHGLPAARIGVKLVDGGAVVTGDDSVLIGGAAFAVPSFIIIEGAPAYQAKVIRDLYKISTTDSGKALLASMAQTGKRWRIGPKTEASSPKNVTWSDPRVEPWNNGELGPDRNHPDAYNGKGADAQTVYTPREGESYATDEHMKTANFPPDVTLYHEATHANDIMHGTTSNKMCENPGGLENPTRCGERRAVGLPPYDGEDISENRYREDRGLPRAPYY